MALITDQPEDLASSNDLDQYTEPDEASTPQRTEVYLSGAHVFTLDHAPRGLEKMTFLVDVEVYEAGGVRFTGENGETQVPICKVRRIGDMYLPGTQRPPSSDEIKAQAAAAKAKEARERAEREEAERAEAEHNEPPMFDEEGDPIDPDAEHGDQFGAEHQGDAEPTAEESAEVDPTVVQFSNAKGKK